MINPTDQAMYFTIGGRKTQSGLYRVTYTRSGIHCSGRRRIETREAELRDIRHSWNLCITPISRMRLHYAWPYLGHADRTIRFAARIALEHQPVATWQEKALAENSSPDAKLTALLALTRCGGKELQLPLIQSMSQLNAEQLVRISDSCLHCACWDSASSAWVSPTADTAREISVHSESLLSFEKSGRESRTVPNAGLSE